jgi:hypothetical protein
MACRAEARVRGLPSCNTQTIGLAKFVNLIQR